MYGFHKSIKCISIPSTKGKRDWNKVFIFGFLGKERGESFVGSWREIIVSALSQK
jgi:hypothetical protein